MTEETINIGAFSTIKVPKKYGFDLKSKLF